MRFGPRISGPNGHVRQPSLKRSMGLWMATALVVGNMVGSGIFTLPAALSGEAGPASIVALAFTGLGAMLLALVFANLGRAHPRTGGPYVLRAAGVRRLRRLPDRLGLLDRGLGRQRGDRRRVRRLPRRVLGRRQDVELARGARRGRCDLAVHVREHPRRPRDGLGAGRHDRAQVRAARRDRHHRPLLHRRRELHAVHAGDGGFDWHVNAAATLALWAFIGLESATVPAEEVKDPEKTIPRATIIGTLATTALYIVALVAIVGVLSQAALAGSSAPFADAANAMWGGTFLGLTWGKWISLVAIAATLGALNGWIMLSARVSLAAADDGLFPRPVLASPERATPVFGLVASSALVSGLVLYNWNVDFGDSLHRHRPARDVDDADRVRVRGGGRGGAVLPRARAVLVGEDGPRHGDRRARLRLLRVGDLGLRRGVARQGLHAPALRDPGLRLHEVA